LGFPTLALQMVPRSKYAAERKETNGRKVAAGLRDSATAARTAEGNNMNERIAIGQTEQAGLPISAPVATSTNTSLRWIRRGDYFTLQECHGEDDWKDVPFIGQPLPEPPKEGI
jgi:hypothetical protein